jgi:hypothetical protein
MSAWQGLLISVGPAAHTTYLMHDIPAGRWAGDRVMIVRDKDAPADAKDITQDMHGLVAAIHWSSRVVLAKEGRPPQQMHTIPAVALQSLLSHLSRAVGPAWTPCASRNPLGWHHIHVPAPCALPKPLRVPHHKICPSGRSCVRSARRFVW